MISKAGGARPQWRRDGKELFFYNGISGTGDVMAVTIDVSAASTGSRTLKAGVPQSLFHREVLETPGRQRWAVRGVGDRFLVAALPDGSSAYLPPITIVLNWPAALNK